MRVRWHSAGRATTAAAAIPSQQAFASHAVLRWPGAADSPWIEPPQARRPAAELRRPALHSSGLGARRPQAPLPGAHTAGPSHAPQHNVAAAVAEKGLGEAAHRQAKGHVLKGLLHLAALRGERWAVRGGQAGGRWAASSSQRQANRAGRARLLLGSAGRPDQQAAVHPRCPKRRTEKTPRSPPARADAQWLSVAASCAKAAGTSGAAAICWRKDSTMACASSALRVTCASFQDEGRRLPACLTSRCEARTCTGALMATTRSCQMRPGLVDGLRAAGTG